MGGRYASLLLLKMNIKIGFCLLLKAYPVDTIEEEFKNYTNEDKKKNKYYLHVSTADPIAPMHIVLKCADKFREFGFSIKIDVDQENKHKVDNNCLIYLKKVFESHFPSLGKF